MIVIDESAAVGLATGALPHQGDELVLPASRHWRLLTAIHSRRHAAPLDDLVARLTAPARAMLRFPDPELLRVLDPRPFLDHAATIAARHGPCSLVVAETMAVALQYAAPLWFGDVRNIEPPLAAIAGELHVRMLVLG